MGPVCLSVCLFVCLAPWTHQWKIPNVPYLCEHHDTQTLHPYIAQTYTNRTNKKEMAVLLVWRGHYETHSFDFVGNHCTCQTPAILVLLQFLLWNNWLPADGMLYPHPLPISTHNVPCTLGTTIEISHWLCCAIPVTFLKCTAVAKSFENDTKINFHKVCCFSVFSV